MRIMYDACNPAHIPRSAQLVAGYIYGNCAWGATWWHAFPNARVVRIATIQTINDGQVLDVERSDATPDQAPGWCARARQRGQDPTVYTSASNWAACRAAFALHGVPEPHWWIAHYGVQPVLPAGAVALQYINEQPPGCDSSVVADYWPGVDPAPATPHKGSRMAVFHLDGSASMYCLYWYAGRYEPIASPEDEQALIAAGASGPHPMSANQHRTRLLTFAPVAPDNDTVTVTTT